MKLVYVAGPFRGRNSWEIENNIRRAEALALQVWELGAACICPHANTRFYQGIGPDERWLNGDLEILRRCDAVMMTLDWQCSTGAQAEREFALDKGIPVFHSLSKLRFWLNGESSTCVNSKPEQRATKRTISPITRAFCRRQF